MKHFFPVVLDNTQVSEFKACPIKGFRLYIQHLAQAESADLIAGGAFAKGIHIAREQFYTHDLDHDEAVAAGINALHKEYGDFYDPWKESKSVYRMELALESYFEEYNMKFDDIKPFALVDGGYSIEYSLLSPLEDFDGTPLLHPTLGLPLLYSGRLDMLASYQKGVYIVDEKTTGSYFTKNWADQWETRSQFTGYKWLAGKSGIPELSNILGAVIRGVCLPSSTSTNEDTKQKFYNNIANIKHQQTITTRTNYEVECWHRSTINTVKQMLQSYTAYLDNNEKTPEKFFDGNFGNHCTSYSKGCQFLHTCKNELGERFLENTYDQHIWRPEQHRRQKLNEYLLELEAMKGVVV